MLDMSFMFFLISSKDLDNCVQQGACLIKIGNYDYLYNNHIILSQKYMSNIVEQALSLSTQINICVDMPYFFIRLTYVKKF